MPSTQARMTKSGQPVTVSPTSKRDGNPTSVISLFGNRQPRVAENPVSALEGMPHLVEKICGLWGRAECEPFINGLILDSRDGARQGLPWEAAQDLLFLAELSAGRRALAAAELTGVPVNQMHARVQEPGKLTRKAPERAGQAANTGLCLEPMTDPWSDPRRSADTARERRPQSKKSTSTDEKTGWLGKLLG